MKTIYVRVAKKGVERFHRCGHQFSGAWAELVGIEKLSQHVVVMNPDVAAIKQFLVERV